MSLNRIEKNAPKEYSRAYRTYFLVLMVIISAFAIIDRVALLTVGQAISRDLGLRTFSSV